MGFDFTIGCVGKPSAGKSTFFNAVTDGKDAKVGAYPFTTIDPNQGISYYTTNCPCQSFQVNCKPRFGSCKNGKRKIPVKLLDIAGLIPGASEGLGLGNKFLDDLRHADVLLHILDVSGTTNEKGEATCGYDPIKDHDWLLLEIELWIFNNLWSRWGNIGRKHLATKSTPAATLLGQLSGYGAKEPLIQQVLEDCEITTPSVDFLTWDKDKVSAFVKKRFSFILVLNKTDMGHDAIKNAIKISEKFDNERVVLASAITECFLKKMKSQHYIDYDEGSLNLKTISDDPNLTYLKRPNEKIMNRLENAKDLILFRLGSTGVFEAIQKAVSVANLVPVYPIRNLQHFGTDNVRQFAKMLHVEIDRHYLYAEGPHGRRLAENDPIDETNNIIKYTTEVK